MPTYSRAPQLTKGAIVGLDPLNPLASIIIFQYNPHTLTRTVRPRNAGTSSNKADSFKLAGAPQETISVTVEVDAADQLEVGDGLTENLGIYPQLSALEMLLYPKSAYVVATTVMAALGTIEVIPPAPPMTLFIWGIKRVVPVLINDLSITEKNHDSGLNPILADVSLNMQVQTYSDLSMTHPGYYVFLTHQVVKEVMATISSANNLLSL